MVFKRHFSKIHELYFKYEKILLPISFFIGLFWDNFTLRRIDLLYENAVFIWGIFQSIIFITLINAYDAGRLKGKIFDKIAPFFSIFLQFSFGNLFSGFIVFYVRSGSFWASWPFLLFLAILFVGNEFFRKRYASLNFQMGVFFIAIFSYSVFSLPVLINKMGAPVFLASGFLALLICGLIFLLFFFIMRERFLANLKRLATTIFSIYIIFQILYFANVIPPIPLSQKDSGIYHSIELAKNGNYFYRVAFEPESKFYLFFKDQSDIFHWQPGSPIYFYSAIFSPADLNLPIFHRWQYFDGKKGNWQEMAKISFKITGGRSEGYRGYTFITNSFPGKWRVDVITERGQILGRREFTVIKSEIAPILETAYR